MKYKVVKVLFLSSNRNYFFSVGDLVVKKGDFVIVESEKGIQFGKVNSEVIELSEEKIIFPLKKIIRIATKEDVETNDKNLLDASKALLKAKTLSKELELPMSILFAYFSFDRSQLVYNFTAEDRVDFRELVKKLAAIYKTRIELRQIGVRDKAKEVGGIGPCGRFLCCNLFLNDFESVSINMAKNQYISLKPDKINGICGRLLCCLNYEDEQYTEMKREFPPIGSVIKFNKQDMKVIGHNLFKKQITLESKDKNMHFINLRDYESNK